MRNGIYLILAVALLSFTITAEAMAGIYACKDRNGTIHFTNVPTSASCKGFIKEKRGSTSSSVRKSYNSSSYDREIWSVGARYDVDPYLIKAVIKAESAFNCQAVSKKGAQGLMQLMPGTAKELCVRDPFNAKDNIDGGTRYLRKMLDTFNNDLMLSIAAYNAGPGAVKRAGGVPKYPETRRYVVNVLKHYKGYRNKAKKRLGGLAANGKQQKIAALENPLPKLQ